MQWDCDSLYYFMDYKFVYWILVNFHRIRYQWVALWTSLSPIWTTCKQLEHYLSFSQSLIEFRLVNFIAFFSLFSYVCKNAEWCSTSFIITVKLEPLFFSNIFYVKTLVSLLKFSLTRYIILLFILSMIELSNFNPYGLFIKSLQVLGSILLHETKKKDIW